MLSKTTKYAIKALIHLGKSDREIFFRVDQLSALADVPGPYLSKIMRTLVEGKIIESRRGLTGGVRLAPELKNLSFFEVCEALREPLITQSCILSNSACRDNQPCSAHSEWNKTRERIVKFLRKSRIF